MRLVPLNTLFEIRYGNQFDLYRLASDRLGAINFVSRSSQNLGVVGKVSKYKNIKPFDAGLITVSLGGTYLLSSFVQMEPFYTGQNVKVLIPKQSMTFGEKLFYCKAIEANRFKYTSHGREANVTLDGLLVPDSVPSIVHHLVAESPEAISSDSISTEHIQLHPNTWKYFTISELFEVKKGKRVVNADMEIGTTPCIRPIDHNNGVSDYFDIVPNHSANTITVNYNGSGVAESFFQPRPFFAVDDVNVLYPKFPMNVYTGMFLVAVIRMEKYRFNYGRKWKLERMRESRIKLPTDDLGNPDWAFMERYIKSLPYSSSI